MEQAAEAAAADPTGTAAAATAATAATVATAATAGASKPHPARRAPQLQDVCTLLVRVLLRLNQGERLTLGTVKAVWRELGFSHIFEVRPARRPIMHASWCTPCICLQFMPGIKSLLCAACCCSTPAGYSSHSRPLVCSTTEPARLFLPQAHRPGVPLDAHVQLLYAAALDRLAAPIPAAPLHRALQRLHAEHEAWAAKQLAAAEENAAARAEAAQQAVQHEQHFQALLLEQLGPEEEAEADAEEADAAFAAIAAALPGAHEDAAAGQGTGLPPALLAGDVAQAAVPGLPAVAAAAAAAPADGSAANAGGSSCGHQRRPAGRPRRSAHPVAG